jgi:succinate dehydrogenase / fumarate reductase, cytochrome b subunit
MRENYALHKLHSLTGIIPVGFYLCQHLTLNSFALAGPEAYDSVIIFFEGLPPHLLAVLKYGVVWLPLIFHAAYGLVITARAEQNYTNASYKWRENRYYTMQRVTGILAFAFLIYHMLSTSIAAKINGIENTIVYDVWADKLSAPFLGIPFFFAAVYMIGIAVSAYHFSYGLWHFCIRWGITISEKAQRNMGVAAVVVFFALCGAGLASLIGFFNPILKTSHPEKVEVRAVQTPDSVPVNFKAGS